MSDSRLITPSRVEEDVQFEAGLRPRTLDDYIGQDRVRENLIVSIAAAKQRGEALDHVLLYGPPGLGKTTLAYVIGNELGVPVRSTSGPVLEKPGDLAAILTNLKEREVLFIDEIHRLPPTIEEILYPAMEDYQLDIMIGQGPSARSVKVPLPPFTLIGATTRAGLLTSPLRSRFGIVHRLDFYNAGGPRGDRPALGAHPRRANRRRRGRGDRAPVARHAARREPAAAARSRLRAGARRRARSPRGGRRPRLRLLEVDEHGFDEIDRRLLRTIIDKFGGGPVGLNTISAVDQRGEGHDRGRLRAVPDPDRLPRSHAARARGDGAGVRVLRAPGAGQGHATLVSGRDDLSDSQVRGVLRSTFYVLTSERGDDQWRTKKGRT